MSAVELEQVQPTLEEVFVEFLKELLHSKDVNVLCAAGAALQALGVLPA